jgi:hypothetical protein
MDEALFALLTGNAAIAARVGSRVFWGAAAQGAALPALVMNIISGRDGGTLAGTDGLWRYRVQIDCYALTRPDARLLSRDVTALLNGFSSPYAAGAFNRISLDATREGMESAAADRPARVSLDFNIIWRG